MTDVRLGSLSIVFWYERNLTTQLIQGVQEKYHYFSTNSNWMGTFFGTPCIKAKKKILNRIISSLWASLCLIPGVDMSDLSQFSGHRVSNGVMITLCDTLALAPTFAPTLLRLWHPVTSLASNTQLETNYNSNRVHLQCLLTELTRHLRTCKPWKQSSFWSSPISFNSADTNVLLPTLDNS